MSRVVSASALLRAKRCPTSFALPQVRETGEAAERGTENHAAVEVQLREARRTGKRDAMQPELADCIDGETIHSIELALVLDTRTGAVRELGEAKERDYGTIDPAHEVPMTLDVVTMRDGNVIVRDWKSRSRVTPAVRNDQIRAQAVAVMALLKVDELQAGLTYLDNWEQDLAHVDSFEAEAILAELRDTLARVQVAKAEDDVSIGSWCDYCPAMASCTGRNKILRATAMMVQETTIEDTLADITDETAGSLYGRITALGAFIEKAEKLLRDRAKHSPLPLANGKVLAAIESSRTSLDTKKAEQMMTAAGMAVPVKTMTYTQVREMNPRKSA